MVSIGFPSVDLAAVASPRSSGGPDRSASILAGALTTGHLPRGLLAIDLPDETIDDPGGTTRPGSPGR